MFEPPEPPCPMGFPYRGERLAWAIAVIGWDKNQFADRIGMNHGSLRQMLANKRFIPDVLGIWVESLAQMHLTFPQPMCWNDNLPPDHPRRRRDEDGNRWVDPTDRELADVLAMDADHDQ